MAIRKKRKRSLLSLDHRLALAIRPRARAGELFFREQVVTTGDGQLMLADAEIVENWTKTGGFGGLGVVLMGDFAQLPPVLSSSLMFGAAIEESRKSGLRPLALAGRQTFASFQHVIRSV